VNSEELLDLVNTALVQVGAGKIKHVHALAARHILSERWELGEDLDSPVAVFYHRGVGNLDFPAREDRSVAREVPRRAPPWLLGTSETFLGHAMKVDRKLRGRVLEVLLELCNSELEPHGDTVKPLSGQFQGCWRYRIGDYRLIFRPNKVAATITAMALLPRGEAYD